MISVHNLSFIFFCIASISAQSDDGIKTMKLFFVNHDFQSVEKAVTGYQALLPVTANVVKDMVRLMESPGNNLSLLKDMQKSLKEVDIEIDSLNTLFLNQSDGLTWGHKVENEVRSFERETNILHKALLYYLTGPPEAGKVLKTIFIGVLMKMPRNTDKFYQGLREQKYLKGVSDMLNAKNRKGLGLLMLRLFFNAIMVDMTDKAIFGGLHAFTKMWVNNLGGLKPWAQSLDTH